MKKDTEEKFNHLNINTGRRLRGVEERHGITQMLPRELDLEGKESSLVDHEKDAAERGDGRMVKLKW